MAEWEEFIYQAAVGRQSIDKLETLDYITNDDDNSNEEYYKMDRELFIMILQHLEKNGKCSVRYFLYNQYR